MAHLDYEPSLALSKNQYCNCPVCETVAGEIIYKYDLEKGIEDILVAHPQEFEKIWKAYQKLLNPVPEEPHAKEKQVKIGHLVTVKPSHTVDPTTGDTTIKWEVVIPKFIMDNYGCSKDQIRKDIKRKGGEALFNSFNHGALYYSEIPKDAKQDDNEDRVIGRDGGCNG